MTRYYSAIIIVLFLIGCKEAPSKTAKSNDLPIEVKGVTQSEYPTEFNGRNITPEAGISMVETLKQETKPKDRQLFWEHFGSKLV